MNTGEMPVPRQKLQGLVATAATAAATATVAATAAATAAAVAASAAATTTAVAATAAAATTAATGAIFAGFGDIDGESAAGVILPVESGDGRLCLGVGGHLDETEAFGSAGIAVGDDFS
jgi:hypothetical protein